jgi:protein involved in temperature-dependent protein secretion
MSEEPERPAQPGFETHVPKDVVAGVQAALDATFNTIGAGTDDAADVEARLRQRLEEHGVGGGVSDAWITDAAGRMAAGEPVAAEPGDA